MVTIFLSTVKFLKFHEALKHLKNPIFKVICVFKNIQYICVDTLINTGIQIVQISHCSLYVRKCFLIYVRCMIVFNFILIKLHVNRFFLTFLAPACVKPSKSPMDVNDERTWPFCVFGRCVQGVSAKKTHI